MNNINFGQSRNTAMLFRLDSLNNRDIHEDNISQGEKRKIVLNRAFVKDVSLYLLDEPSVGLHWYDLDKLIKILQQLADQGNTILVIEHNLDFIKVADHIIDLGPEGGTGGGQIIAQGTPREVAKCKKSFTGQYLKPILTNNIK